MEIIQSIWFETCEGNTMANALEWIREEGKDLAATGKCLWTCRARQGRQPLPRTPAMPAADLPGNRTAMLLIWGRNSPSTIRSCFQHNPIDVRGGRAGYSQMISQQVTILLVAQKSNSSRNELVVLSNTTDASYKLWTHLLHHFIVTQLHGKMFFIYIQYSSLVITAL